MVYPRKPRKPRTAPFDPQRAHDWASKNGLVSDLFLFFQSSGHNDFPMRDNGKCIRIASPSSLLPRPNPFMYTSAEAILYGEQLLHRATMTLYNAGLPTTRAADLVLLTSTVDWSPLKGGRHKYSLETQVDYIRNGLTLEQVVALEIRGLALSELQELKESSADLPQSILDALYPLDTRSDEFRFRRMTAVPMSLSQLANLPLAEA